MYPSITPLGDFAITVTFESSIDEKTNAMALHLFEHLQNKKVVGIKDIIPAYASVTVVYDLVTIKQLSGESAFAYIKRLLEKELKQLGKTETKSHKTLHIPVCYDVSLGLDLEEISQQKQLSMQEIIRIHSYKIYRVYMVGFLPGFAYMGVVDEQIATPRKASPRQNVPAGSVGIADNQTGIYPFNSPGGWNIIGQTPEPLFYPQLESPCLFQPGDLVEFILISINEFNELKQGE